MFLTEPHACALAEIVSSTILDTSQHSKKPVDVILLPQACAQRNPAAAAGVKYLLGAKYHDLLSLITLFLLSGSKRKGNEII